VTGARGGGSVVGVPSEVLQRIQRSLGLAPFRTAVRVVMEPALRLIQGDAHQWSEQTRLCPVIRASGYANAGSRSSTRQTLSPGTGIEEETS